MTATAILLLTVSAITHAGWNLVGKHAHPSIPFFFLANTLGFFLLLPVLFLFHTSLPHIPSTVWILIVATGFCQSFYIIGLASAYRHGDLSISYPIARALPVLLVALLTHLLNTGHPIALQGWIGMLFIVAGTMILPLKRLNQFQAAAYLDRAFFFSLLAALGTTGYALIDDAALKILRNTLSLASWQQAPLYAFFEGLATFFWLLPWIVGSSDHRTQTRQILQTRLPQVVLTGTGIVLTYGLVLISMAFVTNVGYVVAFRQLSIPIGAFLGMTLLNESRSLPKFLGVAILFLGLILVATG